MTHIEFLFQRTYGHPMIPLHAFIHLFQEFGCDDNIGLSGSCIIQWAFKDHNGNMCSTYGHFFVKCNFPHTQCTSSYKCRSACCLWPIKSLYHMLFTCWQSSQVKHHFHIAHASNTPADLTGGKRMLHTALLCMVIPQCVMLQTCFSLITSSTVWLHLQTDGCSISSSGAFWVSSPFHLTKPYIIALH